MRWADKTGATTAARMGHLWAALKAVLKELPTAVLMAVSTAKQTAVPKAARWALHSVAH